jgi:hypothetical protein
MSLKVEVLRSLPCEVSIIAAEMSVSRGLLHAWSAQVQVTNDATGSEVEVVLDNLSQILVRLVGSGEASAVRVNEDRKGMRKTNSVTELNKASVAKASVHQRLGDPSGSVSSRSIDLGGVLTGEGTSSVGTPTSIGINDNLSAGKTSITVRSTNDESARGVQMVDGLLIQVLGRDHLGDNVLHKLSLDVLVGDILRMLGGDQHGVDTDRDHAAIVVLVLASDLGLTIGAHPGAHASLADLGQTSTKRGGQVVGQRHQSLSLISGVTKHDSLITGTDVLQLGVVNGLGDIGGLLLNGNNDVASAVVKTLGDIIISDVTKALADHLLVVDGGGSGDLSEDHNHAGLGASLASHTGSGVITDACVQHSIGHLITDLIGMSLVDRLGRKEKVITHCY